MVAITDEKADKPAQVAANLPSSLRTAAHAAGLVIITAGEFAASLEPLKMARSKQGYKVEIIDVEDLFDEFSAGNKSPQAIKDFLAFAKANWKTGPQYVLFAGDASYDAKNYLGFGDWDVVPTRLIDTQLMEAASDDWFADFNEDGVPELAVGRLPVRSADEAARMVAKIVSYDQSSPSESLLLVADGNEGFDFEEASRQLQALVPANLRVEQINRGVNPPDAVVNVVNDYVVRFRQMSNAYFRDKEHDVRDIGKILILFTHLVWVAQGHGPDALAERL